MASSKYCLQIFSFNVEKILYWKKRVIEKGNKSGKIKDKNANIF